MAIDKRKAKQEELFAATTQLTKSPGHPHYRKLNQVLAEADFDDFAEAFCVPFYKENGCASILPGI